MSGSEMNEAFTWMRSWITPLSAWPATKIKPTKKGMVSNKNGEMLPINFFIFIMFARLYNHTDSKCTVQRNRIPFFNKKILDQRCDFVDQRDFEIRLPKEWIGRWKQVVGL